MFFKEPNQILCGISVPHIYEEEAEERHKPIVDRYFTRYYFTRESHPEEDHLVLFHSNRVCLVGLASNHVAFRKGIESINYNIGHCDRSQNQVKGKGKKGGMNLQATSGLAIVTCSDGTEYKVCSSITGKLIEINENLVGNEKLNDLLKKEGDGFVAIVLPKIENCDLVKEQLLTEDQYKQLRGVVS